MVTTAQNVVELNKRDRPFVTVYAEVSADGKSTHRRGASSKPMMALEDEEIRRYRHELRAASDAIMVGANTARLDNPLLTVRHASGDDPLRIVVTSRADLSPSLNLFSDGQRTLVATTSLAPEDRIASLKRQGAEVVNMGHSQVDLRKLFGYLASRGIGSLVVEGGASLLYSLFSRRLVDRLVVQHLPAIFGGDDVPAMVAGPALDNIDSAFSLRLSDVAKIGGHAVIIYEAGE